MSNSTETLNAELRALMARQGKTQSDLAAALTIPQSQVSERLRGRIDWRVSELSQVAEFLGVPLREILGEVA